MSGGVITFGCRLNLVEGEAIAAIAPAGLTVVNGCAVTEEAVRQAIKAVRRAHREAPDRPIVVTGCAATIAPGRFADMAGVTRVVGNADKLNPESYLHPSLLRSQEPMSRSIGEDIAGGESQGPLPSPGRRTSEPGSCHTGRTRAFVQVQTGCDHRCTFCIIPFARGDGRSVPPEAVVARIAGLVDEGAREVVLSGVDLTGYGTDLAERPTLGDLAARILREVPALPRLRLSSIDAVEIDPALFALIAGEPRLMPHLHLSLQAGDDMILKRMKRRHDRAQAVALVASLKARRPELAIGADLIAGFPTEDERMAARSLALIADCDIVMAHVFPYSPRPGTPAARMPQVEPEVARERARRLRAAAEARRTAWLGAMIGTTQAVLVERGGTGHAENFAKVRLLTSARHPGGSWDDAVGTIVPLRIAAVDGDTLLGTPA